MVENLFPFIVKILSMDRFLKQSEEVYYLEKNKNNITEQDIIFLKNQAKLNKSQKCRICIHKNENELMQEMFIIHTNKCYVRPHFHSDKSESIQVLEGEADLFIFDNLGNITDKIDLGCISSKKTFFYKIDKNIIHTIIIKTDFFLFKESTTGPFKKNMMIYPEWSPINFKNKFNNYLMNFK